MAKDKSKARHASGSNSETLAKRPSKPIHDNKDKLLIEPSPEWHAVELPKLPLHDAPSAVPEHVLKELHNHAKALLDEEAKRYETTQSRSSSSHKFMSTIMSSGTWSDKVSALTLVVQESPLHTHKTLENLISLASKRTRTQALMALAALKDLLAQGVLLPANRKLRFFNKQPALVNALQAVKSWSLQDPLPGDLQEKHLIRWAYEDCLKRSYFDILKILEIWANDEVEFSRVRAVTFVWELLKEKPEQEENLLRLLVNKLGDTDKKVASRASHLLLQLQVTHPEMKSIVIDSIESEILLRPGQNSHAKYYAIITLNQTILQSAHPEVANKLLDVYFGLFVSILNKTKKASVQDGFVSKKRKLASQLPQNNQDVAEQELDDKIVAQVLTGVNRAFPFSQKDTLAFEKHMDTMFRITHSSNFNTSIQALLLIQQISATHDISTDRFMRTLYESLLDPRLIKSSKHTMYLNLLYRSLKADASIRRVKAFVKRLLQVLVFHEPPFVCSALYLVIELQNQFPGVKVMIEHSEATGDDDGDEVFADVSEGGVQVATDTQSKPTAALRAYDGRKRDPEHSNADKTCLWELAPWMTHYHPSAILFATHLLSATTTTKTKAPPKPDPASHTLAHFLDRFVYKHPKKRADANMRGTSLMQPALAATNTTDSLFKSSARPGEPSLVGEPELNTEAFWKKKIEQVQPDEVFFHKYFNNTQAGKERKSKDGSRKKGGEVDAELDEDEVWKALVNSQPELEGAEDSDDDDVDLEMSDEEMDVDGALGDEDFDDELMEEDFPSGGEQDGAGSIDGDESPLDLEDEDGSALFSSESEGEGASEARDAGRKDVDSKSKKQKRRIRDLPTFASVEDYAELLGQDASEDEGIM